MIPALSGMPPAGMRVLIATRPVDFRRGADGLAATVQSVLRQDPFCGTVFVFRSKRQTLRHSAYRSQFVVVAYPWHPLCGQRVRLYGRHGRAGRQILYIEVRPGLSREIPEWMCDGAACATITSGRAQIAIASLIELRACWIAIRLGWPPADHRPPQSHRRVPMRRRLRNQLMFDLDCGGRQRPAIPAPEELLNALADLLLEALGNQNNVMPAEREACDAFQDHP